MNYEVKNSYTIAMGKDDTETLLFIVDAEYTEGEKVVKKTFELDPALSDLEIETVIKNYGQQLKQKSNIVRNFNKKGIID